MTSSRAEAPFTARFIDGGAGVNLELTNTTEQQLKSVEVLTIFLKDEEEQGGPSRANIKFETVKSIQPKESVVLSHRTWIDGKPSSDPGLDQLERLKSVAGGVRPYVLDISWEDAAGRSRYQRIPVGH